MYTNTKFDVDSDFATKRGLNSRFDRVMDNRKQKT